MPNYWTDGVSGVFPSTRSLFMGPTQHLSYGKTTTFSGGSLFTNYDDLDVLADGSGHDVVRFYSAAPSGSLFLMDLGTAQVPDFVALANHNATEVRVRLWAYDYNLTPNVDVTFVPSQKVGWVDLRGFTFAACRYVGVTFTEIDSATGPVTTHGYGVLGELIVGTALEFDGVLDGLETGWLLPRHGDLFEYGVPEVVGSEAGSRYARAKLKLFNDDASIFRTFMETCGLAGRSFLFVPTSRYQEAFWVDWTDELQEATENAVLTEVETVNFVEETFSVV